MMSEAADFCWVGADGALHSGSAGELMHAFLAGSLPAEHPVWRQGWSEWVLLMDVLSERRLEQPGPEADAPATEREAARFSEPETPPTSPLADLTLVDALMPMRLDPDATHEDVTQPFGHRSLAQPAPPTLRSAPPAPPEPPRPRRGVAPERRVSLPPGGTAHTVPPPAQRSRGGWRMPALFGAGLAASGAIAASAIVLTAAFGAPTQALARGVGHHSLVVPSGHALPSPIAACSVRGSLIDVSERVAPGAAVHLASADGGRARLGVASTERSGFGITLALDPLSVEERERFSDPVHMAGVVPTANPRGVKFSVDRFARRVAGPRSFSLGMTPSGFSRITDEGTQTTLWAGQAAAVISRPVVADAGDAGIAVAFRRGNDDSGVVRMGWLDSRGERQSDLASLSVASGRVEAPALATGNGRLLLAYAVRQPADAPWGIELAPAKAGELPSTTLRFTGGDPGQDHLRPAIAALPGARWLIAWAEGDRASGRRIRARVLDSGLSPVGAPLELASTPSSVGTVAIHAEGARALVVFSERARRQSELLRAVAITCP